MQENEYGMFKTHSYIWQFCSETGMLLKVCIVKEHADMTK